MYLGESCAWVSVQGALTASFPHIALPGQRGSFVLFPEILRLLPGASRPPRQGVLGHALSRSVALGAGAAGVVTLLNSA